MILVATKKISLIEGVKSLPDSQTILYYWNRMARPLRIEYSDAWYHVMNRGRSGENVFADEKDYSDLFGLRVAAFCLLSNTG